MRIEGTDDSSRHGRALRVGAVVLAAGRSTRMGNANKMLVEVDQRPMVRRVVEALARTTVRPILVVVGHEADRVQEALVGADVEIVRCHDYERGMSRSLASGVAALGQRGDAVIIALGDMPWVRADHFESIARSYEPERGREICVPTHGGQRGNPVLFGARFFPELATLEGDVGARKIVRAHEEVVHTVPFDDPGVLLDVDTPQALSPSRR